MKINLQAQKGFAYKLPNSIKKLNEKPGFIIPLMNTLRYYGDNQERLIYKTERQISAFNVSAISNHIAIGQISFKGELTTIYLIQYKDNKITQESKFTYQKTKTDVIALSPLGRYFCAAGSPYENQQQLTLVDTYNQNSLGTQALTSRTFSKKQGRIVDITFSNFNQNILVVVFTNRIVVFEIQEYGKLKETVVKASKVREFNKVIFNQTNQLLYACSKNGDISEIDILKNKQIRVGPRKRVIIQGISFIKSLDKQHFVISGFKGFLALIGISQLNIIIQASLKQQIISFSDFNSDGQAFISTNHGAIYKLNGKTLDVKILLVAHNAKVNDIAFIPSFSKVYATCAGSQIMIWKRDKMRPLIRIQLVRNIACNCITFDREGSMLFSGWSDGSLRVFSPINGKEIHKLDNCLNGAKITAIMINNSAEKIVTGGDTGLIRVWNIQKQHFGLIQATLSNHKRAINCIITNSFDLTQFITGSDDGNFGVWSIETYELISMGYICNFIKQLSLKNVFQLNCVGSTSNIFTFLKSNGQINSKIPLQGSHLNSMQIIPASTLFNQFYIIGGQLPKIIFYNKDQSVKVPEPQQVFGEVNKLKLSPDDSSIIVGTVNGCVFQFQIEISSKIKQ